MPVTNEYGNEHIEVGIERDINGVGLWTRHPVTGEPVRMIRVEPEFAREIAASMTIASFECEDLRRQEKSSGG